MTSAVPTGLQQHCSFHDNGSVAQGNSGSNIFIHLLQYGRPHNAVQLIELGWIREDDATQSLCKHQNDTQPTATAKHCDSLGG